MNTPQRFRKGWGVVQLQSKKEGDLMLTNQSSSFFTKRFKPLAIIIAVLIIGALLIMPFRIISAETRVLMNDIIYAERNDLPWYKAFRYYKPFAKYYLIGQRISNNMTQNEKDCLIAHLGAGSIFDKLDEKYGALLLSKGYDINAKCEYENQTPLQYAIVSNHALIVPWLLENGADPDIRFPKDSNNEVFKSIEGMTSLEAARWLDHEFAAHGKSFATIVEILIQN